MSRRIGQSSSNAMLSLEDVMTNAGKWECKQGEYIGHSWNAFFRRLGS